MFKLLVLGCNGLVGRAVFDHFHMTSGFEVYGLVRRRDYLREENVNIFDVDASDFSVVASLITRIEPDIVVNCIGDTSKSPDPLKYGSMAVINAGFPSFLDKLAVEIGFKFYHLSTDCVFSGRQGGHLAESAVPDPVDFYGRSKLAGECFGANTFVFRSSFVGLEDPRRSVTRGLLDWYRSAVEPVFGYRSVFFSGVTSEYFARFLELFLAANVSPGLYHLAGPRISKLDFLYKAKAVFGGPDIIPCDRFSLDRSLDDGMLRGLVGFPKISWDDMLSDLKMVHGDNDV